jgi:mannose-6-phosphate isomerase-like protein (cupin superfamily)
MADFTQRHLRDDVEDSAKGFGMSPQVEAHFAREALGLQHSGVSLQRLQPNERMPFGHRHEHQEEVYVVVDGAGRMKLDDELIEVRAWDAIRVSPETARAFEAGPEGIEFLAFGAAPAEAHRDVEMLQGWWEGA